MLLQRNGDMHSQVAVNCIMLMANGSSLKGSLFEGLI